MTPLNAQQIEFFQLKANGLCVGLTNYGASLQDLRLLSDNKPLVLGFVRPADYASHHSHMGATAGRCANRIGQGHLKIDNVTYQLDKNEAGKTTLHGGAKGCGTALWDVVWHDETSIRFSLTEDDGHMGFPGRVKYNATYRITGPETLTISYEATTTKATIVNLAHHSYFRLDDQPDIRGHELEIIADHYLPVDEQNLPTGEIAPVSATSFDFRKSTPIGTQKIDHNFCLSLSADEPPHMRQVARLYSPHSGIEMRLSSDQPGLQIYTAHHLSEKAPNHHARAYQAHDGICLEPQNWPNSPNMPDFPSSLLRPGALYRQELSLQFAKVKGVIS